MCRSRVGLAGLLLCLAQATPANAQSGLYEPFPSAAQRERAERFVDKLETEPVPASALDDGAFTGDALTPAGSGTATARAAAPERVSAAWFWACAAALLAACAVPALRAGVRRSA